MEPDKKIFKSNSTSSAFFCCTVTNNKKKKSPSIITQNFSIQSPPKEKMETNYSFYKEKSLQESNKDKFPSPYNKPKKSLVEAYSNFNLNNSLFKKTSENSSPIQQKIRTDTKIILKKVESPLITMKTNSQKKNSIDYMKKIQTLSISPKKSSKIKSVKVNEIKFTKNQNKMNELIVFNKVGCDDNNYDNDFIEDDEAKADDIKSVISSNILSQINQVKQLENNQNEFRDSKLSSKFEITNQTTFDNQASKTLLPFTRSLKTDFTDFELLLNEEKYKLKDFDLANDPGLKHYYETVNIKENYYNEMKLKLNKIRELMIDYDNEDRVISLKIEKEKEDEKRLRLLLNFLISSE